MPRTSISAHQTALEAFDNALARVKADNADTLARIAADSQGTDAYLQHSEMQLLDAELDAQLETLRQLKRRLERMNGIA